MVPPCSFGPGPRKYPRGVASDARFWTHRLRWRLAGAWQWPTFVVVTALDAVIVSFAPPTGGDLGLVPALILAAFGNLVLVGAIAPWLVRRLERRRPTDAGQDALPREVLQDRAGTALLCAGAVGLLAAGLAARPLVVSPTEETELNAALVREYALTRGSPEMRRNLDTANTERLSEGYFRTCIAADDRRRAICVFVDTRPHPPTVVPDPNPSPNERVYGRTPGG